VHTANIQPTEKSVLDIALIGGALIKRRDNKAGGLIQEYSAESYG
jgi:hypothetical protein